MDTYLCFSISRWVYRASQMALMVQILPANAEDERDTGSNPVSEDPLEEVVATHYSILAMDKNPTDRGVWRAMGWQRDAT